MQRCIIDPIQMKLTLTPLIIMTAPLYNYYKLALQNWCSSQNTQKKIHGLWGDLTSTSYPSYCSQIPFNLTELENSPQYPQLLKYWYDCTQEQTNHLYEHEWSKHGTCIQLQTNYTQNEYFEKALELYTQFQPTTDDDSICFDLDYIKIDCPP